MALAAYPLSMQLAAVTGVLGLSFWVVLTNLVGLKELWREKQPRKGFLRWVGVAIFPYAFGAVFWVFHAGVTQRLNRQKRDCTEQASKMLNFSPPIVRKKSG